MKLTSQIYRDPCSQLILSSFLCRFVEVLLPSLFVTTLWGFFMTLSSIELIFDFSVMNLLTPLNDQERISPYNISTISSRQVMRIKNSINRGLLVNSLPNFPINITRTIWQTTMRITNEIWKGVKGLIINS